MLYFKLAYLNLNSASGLGGLGKIVSCHAPLEVFLLAQNELWITLSLCVKFYLLISKPAIQQTVNYNAFGSFIHHFFHFFTFVTTHVLYEYGFVLGPEYESRRMLQNTLPEEKPCLFYFKMLQYLEYNYHSFSVGHSDWR